VSVSAPPAAARSHGDNGNGPGHHNPTVSPQACGLMFGEGTLASFYAQGRGVHATPHQQQLSSDAADDDAALRPRPAADSASAAASSGEAEHDHDHEHGGCFEPYFWHFDMLLDEARNRSFDAGIRAAIDIVRLRRRQPGSSSSDDDGGGSSVRVLDIGTGSGLLSMLALKHGAHHVAAVELVPEMAAVAQRNFDALRRRQQQGQEQRQGPQTVQLLRGSSRTLTASSLPLPRGRADILVCELLETGLLGEGMLATLRHAKQNLLEPGFVAVPAAATVHVCLVRGACLRRWAGAEAPPAAAHCRNAATRALPPAWLACGVSLPKDIHAEALLREKLIEKVSADCTVFEFDFGSCPPRPGCWSAHAGGRTSIQALHTTSDGEPAVSILESAHTD
jgi:SAM-dependent methyltransferase